METAYKCFEENMQGWDNFQYEIGKTYELDGKREVGINWFDYYKRIVDIEKYWNLKDGRVCEIEVLGNKSTDCFGKLITDRIRIVRELSKEEINQYFEDNWEELIKIEENWIKGALIKYGFGLSVLSKDPYWFIRYRVSLHGRPEDLDILVYDEEWSVRKEVARHGRPKDLDILVHDKEENVQDEVKKHGRPDDLNILGNNKYIGSKKEV